MFAGTSFIVMMFFIGTFRTIEDEWGSEKQCWRKKNSTKSFGRGGLNTLNTEMSPAYVLNVLKILNKYRYITMNIFN